MQLGILLFEAVKPDKNLLLVNNSEKLDPRSVCDQPDNHIWAIATLAAFATPSPGQKWAGDLPIAGKWVGDHLPPTLARGQSERVRAEQGH